MTVAEIIKEMKRQDVKPFTGLNFLPHDRSMPKHVYKTLRRTLRYMAWKHRPVIEAEFRLRMKNFYIYGTTHPEAY